MPNTYFQFKQFRIEQDQCAMKVCTDACIMGAYAAKWLAQRNKNFKNILDIGTGTGLLTLMLAQKSPSVRFEAVELDIAACLQAKENFMASPWPENISLIQGDIRALEVHRRYDFIICNPPFYEDEMKSPEDHKNQSKHGITLSHRELKESIIKNLAEEGLFCIMLPEKQFSRFVSLAGQEGYVAVRILKVRQSPHHACFRVIGFFSKKMKPPMGEELCIDDVDRQYSQEFKTLLKDYYLYIDA